jgi:hypothetical protein
MNQMLVRPDEHRRLVENHNMVRNLIAALSSGRHSIGTVAPLIELIIAEHAWQDRIDPHSGARYQFRPHEFRRFLESPPPAGLGANLNLVRTLLGDDTPERVAFENAIVGERGGANNPEGIGGKSGKQTEIVNAYNINIDNKDTERASAGTARSYAYRKLSKERPDLLERVIAGEMSAHAAMIEAGFRKPPCVLRELRKWWRRASEAEKREFLTEISDNIDGGSEHRKILAFASSRGA